MQRKKKIETTARTIEFTVEKSETRVFRRRRQAVFCSGCGRDVRMLRPEDAAQIAGIRTRNIYQKIEAGEVHFVEFGEGDLLVCLDSIRKELER